MDVVNRGIAFDLVETVSLGIGRGIRSTRQQIPKSRHHPCLMVPDILDLCFACYTRNHRSLPAAIYTTRPSRLKFHWLSPCCQLVHMPCCPETASYSQMLN